MTPLVLTPFVPFRNPRHFLRAANRCFSSSTMELVDEIDFIDLTDDIGTPDPD